MLWVSGFTIPSAHGETPHMPLGINSVCRYRYLPCPDKDDGTSHVHLTSNSVVGAYHHPVLVGVVNKARSIRTLPLSLVRPPPSSIKGDVPSPNKDNEQTNNRRIIPTHSLLALDFLNLHRAYVPILSVHRSSRHSWPFSPESDQNSNTPPSYSHSFVTPQQTSSTWA